MRKEKEKKKGRKKNWLKKICGNERKKSCMQNKEKTKETNET